MEIKKLSYDEFQTEFTRLSKHAEVAELHGAISAFISSGEKISWQEFKINMAVGLLTIPDDEMPFIEPSLELLYQTINEQLADQSFAYDLMLPTDDETLKQRLATLAVWCRGFLYGLHFCNVNFSADDSDDIREGIQHLEEIAKVDNEAFQDEDEAEMDYVELHEYVRMLVILMYDHVRQSKQLH